MTEVFGGAERWQTAARFSFKRLSLLVAGSFLFAAGAFGYTATNAGPSKSQALAAIAVLDKGVLLPDAMEAARTIVTFADKSDTVMVNIGDDALPWTAETWTLPKETQTMAQSLLLAAFVSGNIKTQLASGKPLDDPYSGWLSALKAYQEMKSELKLSSPSLDQLTRMRDQKTLRDHANELLKNAPAPSGP